MLKDKSLKWVCHVHNNSSIRHSLQMKRYQGGLLHLWHIIQHLCHSVDEEVSCHKHAVDKETMFCIPSAIPEAFCVE